jgi:hypothetical protein
VSLASGVPVVAICSNKVGFPYKTRIVIQIILHVNIVVFQMYEKKERKKERKRERVKSLKAA